MGEIISFVEQNPVLATLFLLVVSYTMIECCKALGRGK